MVEDPAETFIGTINVAAHPFFLNDGRRGYLVDTPGFDDGQRTEAEILQEVSNFFAATYKMHIKLAGIIYLHRISDNRMSKSMFKNLRMMKKLCGEDCYSKIVLATTMWDTMANDMPKAIQNEAQLAETHDWWGDLLEAGATTMRQDDGWRSAMKIVERVMSFNAPRRNGQPSRTCRPKPGPQRLRIRQSRRRRTPQASRQA